MERIGRRTPQSFGQKFYFFHIHKCAGTSMVDIAARNVRLAPGHRNGNLYNAHGEKLLYWKWSEACRLSLLSDPAFDFIAQEGGPALPDLLERHDVTSLVILRDPISRLLSHIGHRLRLTPKTWDSEGVDLGSWASRNWANNYFVRKLSGQNPGKSPDLALQLAKENLAKFNFVFTAETFSRDVAILRKRFGWRIGRTNSNVRGIGALSGSLTQQVKDDLFALNSLDYELIEYAAAGRNWVSRMRARK